MERFGLSQKGKAREVLSILNCQLRGRNSPYISVIFDRIVFQCYSVFSYLKTIIVFKNK